MGEIAVVTTLQVKAGCEAELDALLARLAGTVRAREAGCLDFRPLRSEHDAQHYVILERYRDRDALDAHANAEHFREAFPPLMACLAGPPRLALYRELDAG